MINLLDPDVIVLGGGLSRLRHLYEQVPALWSPWIFGAGSSRVRTASLPARHGDASGVRGAAWRSSAGAAGVPFSEVAGVREWLGLEGPVGQPRARNPRRPVRCVQSGRCGPSLPLRGPAPQAPNGTPVPHRRCASHARLLPASPRPHRCATGRARQHLDDLPTADAAPPHLHQETCLRLAPCHNLSRPRNWQERRAWIGSAPLGCRNS
ncbi:MAG TPA: ROK family protein [Rubrivivax sp.]|nr:ROK family protein [Rubrivivax sp.]